MCNMIKCALEIMNNNNKLKLKVHTTWNFLKPNLKMPFQSEEGWRFPFVNISSRSRDIQIFALWICDVTTFTQPREKSQNGEYLWN